MDRIKKQNKLISIGLSLIMLILMLGVQPAHAEGVFMDDLREAPGTLEIETKYVDEGTVTLISGIELSIYQVASLSVNQGEAKYALTEEFADSGVEFSEMTADESMAAAGKFADMVKEKNISGRTVVSENGTADFGAVEHGIYLVCQTGKKGTANEYTELKPYLVMTPQRSLDNESAWEYDVVSIPKMGIENKTIKITKKVNNLDDVQVEMRTDKFAYDIEAELGYSPESFAVVDHVPEALEIVDTNTIVIKIGDDVLTREERDAMLTIEGNDLRVDFNKEQIQKWYPLKMSINFRCRFRRGVELDEGLSVVNVAGYEVEGVYYEPPGDEHKAEVKGVSKDEVTEENPIVKAVRTGDYANIAIWIALLAAAVAIIIIFVIRRRRRDN